MTPPKKSARELAEELRAHLASGKPVIITSEMCGWIVSDLERAAEVEERELKTVTLSIERAQRIRDLEEGMSAQGDTVIALREKLASLEAQLAAAQERADTGSELFNKSETELAAELATAQERAAELERDAGRYRTLKRLATMEEDAGHDGVSIRRWDEEGSGNATWVVWVGAYTPICDANNDGYPTIDAAIDAAKGGS